MTWIESLAYAIARGVARGIADATIEMLERSHTAVEEAVSEEDRTRAIRARDAIHQWMRSSGNPG